MKGKEIVFIAPALYTNKEMLTNKFLRKNPFTYQIVLVDNEDYSITSLPTHIVIDKELKVVDKLIGYSPQNIERMERSIIENLDK